MSKFMHAKFAQLEPYTPGEQPKNLDALIKLNTNESPYAPSPAVVKAVDTTAVSQLRLYNDPTCDALLDALADTFDVPKTQVYAGNGSDEVLAFAFMAFCQQGVAFADITYGFYEVFAQLFGVDATLVPLRDDLTIAVEDYAEQKGTVVLVNPHAPTGYGLPLSDVEILLRQNKDRLVIVDEAYVDFGSESARALLPQYDNLLIIGTFSKSRNLAGARLGYAIGSEALIADLNTIKFSFNPYNINTLTQLAGVATLSDPDYFASCIKHTIRTRDYTMQALRALGFTVLESKTNFVLAKPPAPWTGEAYFKALREHGFLARWFAQERVRAYVRISLGTKTQMELLVKTTTEILKGEPS